jgi:hypothetical protein
MDLGKSGGFKWDAVKKKYMFDDHDENEQESEDLPPPARSDTALSGEFARQSSTRSVGRYVDPFGGSISIDEIRPSSEMRKIDEDDSSYPVEDDFMTNRPISLNLDLMESIPTFTTFDMIDTDRLCSDRVIFEDDAFEEEKGEVTFAEERTVQPIISASHAVNASIDDKVM